ncbi:MAG: hypothetical protein IH787_05870 [Nitrospirae bacterium]|nr:hypothetical protein [Nitrospirota bacterium]
MKRIGPTRATNVDDDENRSGGAVRQNSRYVILTPDGSVRGDLGDVPAAGMFARLQMSSRTEVGYQQDAFEQSMGFSID